MRLKNEPRGITYSRVSVLAGLHLEQFPQPPLGVRSTQPRTVALHRDERYLAAEEPLERLVGERLIELRVAGEQIRDAASPCHRVVSRFAVADHPYLNP